MGMVKKINRFEVWLIELDPTKGSEVKKTRPCLIVSPDPVNKHLNTITIVPLTTSIRSYPTRVNCIFQGREGQAMVDQIRGLDKTRLKRKLGIMENRFCKVICDTIVEAYKWQ
jgi:mRNA interferase MazF